MKKNILTLLTVIGLITIVACKPIVNNIYCLGTLPSEPPSNQERQDVPDTLTQDNTMLYYKVDDNVNFQTLVFAVEGDTAYTIIGRFNGKHLPNDMYQINSLEFVAYNLFSKKRDTYKVRGVSVLHKESSIDFEVFLDSNAGSAGTSEGVDHTYKAINDTPPLIINRSTMLSFIIKDIDGNKFLPGGGYECNALPSYRGRR